MDNDITFENAWNSTVGQALGHIMELYGNKPQPKAKKVKVTNLDTGKTKVYCQWCHMVRNSEDCNCEAAAQRELDKFLGKETIIGDDGNVEPNYLAEHGI